MRTLIFAILIALMCDVAGAVAGEPPISIAMAIPSLNAKSDDGRRIRYNDLIHNAPHFNIIVSNTSDQPQRIWQEWCSWGYYGLSFEITDEHGKKWIARKKPISFTVNFPDWWTLEPQESMVIEVYFADPQKWLGFPMPENGTQTVTMRAILESKPDDDAKRKGVWTGRVFSKAEKVTFERWQPDTK